MDEKYKSIDPYGEENWDDDTPIHLFGNLVENQIGHAGTSGPRLWDINWVLPGFYDDVINAGRQQNLIIINKMKETCKAKKLENLAKSIRNNKNYKNNYGKNR